MLFYVFWVPCAVVYYVFYSWLAKQNNELGGGWSYAMFIFGALCPFWLIVSKYSRRLLFDGMLYDNVMFLTYVGTMVVLGAHGRLSCWQWVGVSLVVVGSVLMRVDLG